MLKKTLFNKNQCGVLSGYIIKYSKKNSFFAEYGDTKKAFCSKCTLIHILQNEPNYTIWRANFTDIYNCERIEGLVVLEIVPQNKLE